MTTTQANQAAADRFGRRVAARLSVGAAELPYEVSERLRAARTRAVAARKRLQPRLVPHVLATGGAAALGFDEEGLGLWGRIASALPLVVLAAGLVFIHVVQQDRRASELAEVDVALLVDDLPPAAYADPGFVQFLQLAQGGSAAPRR
ncbi:MAG TPA: DUF3619 family protein [Ramlibacter sp.]|uniref:DUF3619 family protein n=1 Tax=Ramlibacter sp. TaxID=1917967 RepID=UPI002BC3264C|nr:DUF3619 family protein [Ramlibacter sp.]HVZ44652.1 DUF3619 family protein [Ramlibacter sp.]